MYKPRNLRKIAKEIEKTPITKESLRPFTIVDGVEAYLERHHKGQFRTRCYGLDEGVCRTSPMRIAKFLIYLFDCGIEMLTIDFYCEDDIFFIAVKDIELTEPIPNEFLMEAELSGFYIRQEERGVVLSMPIQKERFSALLFSIDKINFSSILEGARTILDELEEQE